MKKIEMLVEKCSDCPFYSLIEYRSGTKFHLCTNEKTSNHYLDNSATEKIAESCPLPDVI